MVKCSAYKPLHIRSVRRQPFQMEKWVLDCLQEAGTQMAHASSGINKDVKDHMRKLPACHGSVR